MRPARRGSGRFPLPPAAPPVPAPHRLRSDLGLRAQGGVSRYPERMVSDADLRFSGLLLDGGELVETVAWKESRTLMTWRSADSENWAIAYVRDDNVTVDHADDEGHARKLADGLAEFLDRRMTRFGEGEDSDEAASVSSAKALLRGWAERHVELAGQRAAAATGNKRQPTS